MEEFSDKEIPCAEAGCGTFTWTARDQAFYAEKGYSQPKRCKKHAAERRAFFNAHPEKAQTRGKRHE